MATTARDRRHLIRLQQLVQATDPDYGGPLGDAQWINIAQVWAKRSNPALRGSAELVAAGTTISQQVVRFDFRARDIDPAWRVVDAKGRIYDIKAIADDNANGETGILVEWGANHG